MYFFKETQAICCDYSFEVGCIDLDRSVQGKGLQYIAKVFSFDYEAGSIIRFERAVDVIEAGEIAGLDEIGKKDYDYFSAEVQEFCQSITDLAGEIQNKEKTDGDYQFVPRTLPVTVESIMEELSQNSK